MRRVGRGGAPSLRGRGALPPLEVAVEALDLSPDELVHDDDENEDDERGLADLQ